MAKPRKHSDEKSLRGIERTFFVSTKSVQGRALLQSDRHAMLLIDTMRSYVKAGNFIIHDFVVMPNHLHVLITVDNMTSIEKAMQLIKGSFSYRVRKELGYQGEVWQRGYSEVRIRDRGGFLKHRDTLTRTRFEPGWRMQRMNTPMDQPFAKSKNTVAKAELFFD